MKTILNRVPVLFDPDTHTYTNEETGELLSGITGTLLKRLFPSKYDGVPKDYNKRFKIPTGIDEIDYRLGGENVSFCLSFPVTFGL